MCCVFLRLLFTPCIFLTLLTFSCLTEKWGYLGWWGSSAHPAAPIIQSWLCNPVELQKRNPNAPGDCEVSTHRFIVESFLLNGKSFAVSQENDDFVSQYSLQSQRWSAEDLRGWAVVYWVLPESEPKILWQLAPPRLGLRPFASTGLGQGADFVWSLLEPGWPQLWVGEKNKKELNVKDV